MAPAQRARIESAADDGSHTREEGRQAMARRSIFASVALTILLVATAPQLAIASARATHKQFCAKARGEFYGRDIHVGDTVQVNMGAFNCSTQREHVPTTWR